MVRGREVEVLYETCQTRDGSRHGGLGRLQFTVSGTKDGQREGG
jgi:hypothetical protein